MNILAGEKLLLQWDEEAKDFTAAGSQNGAPTFTVISLDYFTAQAVLGNDDDDEKVRACITAGLISVEGGDCDAAAWLAAPSAPMVNPLFHKIWQHTWGN
jgi:hypothetical protein